MNDIVCKRIKIRTEDDDNRDEWCLASLSLKDLGHIGDIKTICL